jgi:hypothetical protein
MISLCALSGTEINSLYGPHYVQTLQGMFWNITIDNALIKPRNKINPRYIINTLQPRIYKPKFQYAQSN